MIQVAGCFQVAFTVTNNISLSFIHTQALLMNSGFPMADREENVFTRITSILPPIQSAYSTKPLELLPTTVKNVFLNIWDSFARYSSILVDHVTHSFGGPSVLTT